MHRKLFIAGLLHLVACTTTQSPNFEVAKDSVQPGTAVSRQGKPLALAHGKLAINDSLPATELTDSNWQSYKFAADGKVKLVSVVPSVDTKVCEQQTHLLGETKVLHPAVERVTLSRDLPAAQKRFAEEAHLTNVKYLSDYRAGDFGKASGLLIEESSLLARAVLIVDGQGKVRYIQVVPNVAQLPDMERAFAEANKLVR